MITGVARTRLIREAMYGSLRRSQNLSPFEKRRKSSTLGYMSAMVYLLRNPSPARAPARYHHEGGLRVDVARARDHTVAAQKKIRSTSVVMRMEPTENIGMITGSMAA